MRMTKWEMCQCMCEGGDAKQLLGEDSVVFVCVNAHMTAILQERGVAPHIQTRSSHSQMKGSKP